MAKSSTTKKKKAARNSASGVSISLPGNLSELLREIGLLVIFALAAYLLVCLMEIVFVHLLF